MHGTIGPSARVPETPLCKAEKVKRLNFSGSPRILEMEKTQNIHQGKLQASEESRSKPQSWRDRVVFHLWNPDDNKSSRMLDMELQDFGFSL